MATLPLRDEAATGWLASVSEMAARWSAEQLLRESEARFRTLADTAPVMVWQSGTDALCDFFNKGWLDFTGRSLEQELGNGWADGVHPDDHQRCLATYLSSFHARQPFTLEYRLRRADGEYRWLLDNGVPRYTPSGEFAGYVGSCIDITELKRTEHALRESEARNQDLLRALPDLMFVQDKDGVYLDFHASDVSDLLVPPAQFLGKNMRDVLPPELADRIATCFREASGSNEPSVMEYALQLDQQVRHFEARIIRGQQGTFLSIVRDITERKLAEDALQRAQADLGLAARRVAMGALAASIAHEINQPLTAIVSNASAGVRLLAAGQLEDVKATLEDVIKDGQRAANVMEQTRALFMERAPRIERVNLNQAILDVIAIVRHEILRHGAVLSTDLADSLPTVQGDRIQLQQVLLNLIMNGLEAMDGVHDRAHELVIRSRKSPFGAVVISVADSGMGFDPKDETRLFEAFYTTKPTGMGMGLSITRAIVTRLGGELWAMPNSPHGSLFQFMLTANRDADADIRSES